MVSTFEWSKETYERSVSSYCWSWTPYGDGWEGCVQYGGDLRCDEELRAIVAMEAILGQAPEWAQQVVRGPIECVAPCGHYTFPLSYLDAVRAIGTGVLPPVHHTCFTVNHLGKRRLQDLAFMLDAWLAGAEPAAAAAELQYRETLEPAIGGSQLFPDVLVEWSLTCAGLWGALGEYTELKELLVERLLHQLRWWVKVTVWDDDLGGAWGRDQYVGNWQAADDLVSGNGNSHLRALSGYRQASSPRVQRLEARLGELCPQWNFFRTVIVDFSWPCGPKAFRYYEKLLWCIGRERQVISLPSFPLADPEPVPNYLGVLAATPDRATAAAWWQALLAALDGWWREEPVCGGVADEVNTLLGESTPVKRWLVRLYVHRLRMLEIHSGILHKLVSA